MLPRKSRMVLKKLLKIYGNNQCNKIIKYHDIKENIKLNENDIINSLYILKDEKLIGVQDTLNGIGFIIILPNCIYYFEMNLKKIINNILKSFITPIVVSTIVSIITVFIIK